MANYSIIGDDGKEYGPVPAAELQKWVAEGRAGPQTKVRPEGATEWMPLSQVPELAGASKKTPPPLPTHLPPEAGKLSIMAVASLVLGILGCTALFGLILGIIAMVRVSNSKGALRGKGIALAGVIVSGVFLVLLPILILPAMLLPALAAAKGKAQVINCINNEKQLALAVRIYSGDHTNQFPPAATWCDAIKASVGSDRVFKCPAANEASACGYAFNAKLDGVDADKVNPQTVMIFEADTGWNAHGGPEMHSSRHFSGDRAGMAAALADGSVQIVREKDLSTLRWDP